MAQPSTRSDHANADRLIWAIIVADAVVIVTGRINHLHHYPPVFVAVAGIINVGGSLLVAAITQRHPRV